MKILLLIKNKLKYEFSKARDNLYLFTLSLRRTPKVFSMDETIDKIITDRSSIARYGDGEFDMIYGRNQGFQKSTVKLGERLKEILTFNNNNFNLLIGIPDIFENLSKFTNEAQLHWTIRLKKDGHKWYNLLNRKYPYYNSQITRFYFDWVDKSQSPIWAEKLKKIWDDRELVIVEGDKSRLGIGNDLFDNSKSIQRILCPSENAFDIYDEILKSITENVKKESLLLLALGPTATVLAYDLSKLGYQALDVGHIDIEYEWMLNNVKEKTAIIGKYVNEVSGGNTVGEISDKAYENQIILRIGC